MWIIWKDVKLLSDGLAVLFLLTRFFNHELDFPIQQGDGEDIWGSIQRSSSYDPRISPGTPGDVPATPFQFPRQWHPAKPRTGASICFQFRFCTVATICLSSFDFSRLTIPLSKDVESILRTVFHVGSSNFSCQVYWSVFCTYDTFHISNSIRYFWASVCEWVSDWLCVWVSEVSEWGGGRAGGRGGGYRTKNKNPTRQCGELSFYCPHTVWSLLPR